MSTVNIFYKISTLLPNNALIEMDQYATPQTITAAAGVGSDTTYLVPTATVFTLTDDLDVTTDLVVILSPVNATLEWDNGTDANNSSIGIKANIPFIMPNLLTTEYSAIASTRTSNTLDKTISAIRIYHAAGTTQKVRVVTFD